MLLPYFLRNPPVRFVRFLTRPELRIEYHTFPKKNRIRDSYEQALVLAAIQQQNAARRAAE